MKDNSNLIGIVIVAHGGLAREYLAAVEHVMGKQTDVSAISIDAECDRPGKKSEICQAAKKVDKGSGVVIVTDMFGGSPFNLSQMACNTDMRRIIYGANLPLLIKLTKSRHLPLETAIAASLEAGRKYINVCAGSQVLA